MHRWFALLLCLLILLSTGGLLSACGQKGALYLPEQPQQQEEEEK